MKGPIFPDSTGPGFKLAVWAKRSSQWDGFVNTQPARVNTEAANVFFMKEQENNPFLLLCRFKAVFLFYRAENCQAIAANKCSKSRKFSISWQYVRPPPRHKSNFTFNRCFRFPVSWPAFPVKVHEDFCFDLCHGLNPLDKSAGKLTHALFF